jgi:sulfite reductase alpha subunit-like flavoprotein
MNVEVNPNEDTEWNDILRAHGVIPEKPPSPSEQIEQALEEALQRAHENRLEHKTLDELDEIDEDGLEDEEFVEMYRRKRMAEMQAQALREQFGEVLKISKPEYTSQVTDASENDVTVMLHISNSGVPQSKLLSALFSRIAQKFRDVKFVEIDSRQINERYPPENCPTILVYRNKDLVKQLSTLNTIGGNSTNLSDIERLLVTVGAVRQTDHRLIVNQDHASDNEGDPGHRRYDSDEDFD